MSSSKSSLSTWLKKIRQGFVSKLRASWWLIPIVSAGLIFVAFYAGWVPIKGTSFEERGQFGDSFGVLNSLFTGLGFGGVVVTLILQQRQLAHQEAEIKVQRESEERRHYEETLHRLLGLYTQTLNDLSAVKGGLKARSVLGGSISRAMSAVKADRVNNIPHDIQVRYRKRELTADDSQFLDYVYFRNFKILAVEIDRQARLVETLLVLLNHLVESRPDHVSLDRYSELVCSQLTHIEFTYFFLVALAFAKEAKLRELLIASGLIARIAHVKRLQVHDYMYSEFWRCDIAAYKVAHASPIPARRIQKAITVYRRRSEASAADTVPTISYTSSRVRKPISEKVALVDTAVASNDKVQHLQNDEGASSGPDGLK